MAALPARCRFDAADSGRGSSISGSAASARLAQDSDSFRWCSQSYIALHALARAQLPDFPA